mmetsp:Transcript_71047/g.148606  ORF Transcript_71047/g.148606 Transcript_71047/m.148606 type:complete len:339 (+) Transcript_71047:243-1259(+)
MEVSQANETKKHAFLERKFQVGSANSDKVNYSLAEKFFHNKDVKPEVLEAKKQVMKKKQANILGTEPREWNSSTLVDPKAEKDVASRDLKRQLLKVRAGLMDERVAKPSKFHTDDAIAERHKFIVSVTGKGPIGKLTGQWFNTVDERGLAKHCIADHWPDWNNSHSCHTKDDVKEAKGVFERKEQKRVRQNKPDRKLTTLEYISPVQAVQNVNDCLRERKIDFQDLKEQFKRELKVEFPQASEERLQAMAQRLLNEKLLADEKMARFPVQHESFRPNLSLTTQDRRYKEYFHPGTYGWMECEKRYGWSCCINFDQDSRGCEHKIANPDSWCLLGFERR